jgi:hypothetical protein
MKQTGEPMRWRHSPAARGADLLTACSRGDDTHGHGTTPADTDNTWNQDLRVERATLGSGGREAVGVRVSPLARL